MADTILTAAVDQGTLRVMEVEEVQLDCRTLTWSLQALAEVVP